MHGVGDRVNYSGGFGSEESQPGKITGFGSKNGKRVIDVITDKGSEHWGYVDQFSTIPGSRRKRRR